MFQFTFLRLLCLQACHRTPSPDVIQGELQPLFWRNFTHSMGCAPDHLYAWNDDDTIGIDVFLFNPFLIPNDQSEYTVDLSQPGNRVLVETGNSISTNFCVTDIQIIPVRRVYEATDGRIQVSVDHAKGQLGATLYEVTLHHPLTNHQITISEVQFPVQPLYVRKE